jgi:NAD(P)-dependent dehydrogenase (short-subunit alcohol dehydrogenase family)
MRAAFSVLVCNMDVANAADVRAMCETVVQKFGGIEILSAIAGPTR